MSLNTEKLWPLQASKRPVSVPDRTREHPWGAWGGHN
jgi:hypothetical protein